MAQANDAKPRRLENLWIPSGIRRNQVCYLRHSKFSSSHDGPGLVRFLFANGAVRQVFGFDGSSWGRGSSVRVAPLQNEVGKKVFLFEARISHEKCSEIFPKISSIYYIT